MGQRASREYGDENELFNLAQIRQNQDVQQGLQEQPAIMMRLLAPTTIGMTQDFVEPAAKVRRNPGRQAQPVGCYEGY
ncbi:unnamed protein product [Rotaria sp. Silwood1]|nr:unnamed protein product [Rotaria sp. Silwood1]CAF0856643.1 unnamed protein product [Rotaria sp. Silwood1]CAF3378907.1 unnamed protein product [Rotaria sp. Silwood1]CAF3381646.1 unnamed protein product [Rotaria sp. Silwood1]CAF3386450.1 unnamed protein product [Rotaria sp. Silwood1]